MVTHDDVLNVLRTIDDPEMAINIVDLGLVERIDCQTSATGVHVQIEILPSFVGCHALPVIEGDIRRRVAALSGVTTVEVQISYSPPWTVDRVTPAGRETLRSHGITVPQAGDDSADRPPSCPYCGSTSVREESPFGPTRCRAIWYCESCRHPFESLKRVATSGVTELSLGRLHG
jgi:ring-1,2-phenylacetyl-CoA epoxidase subunit PaaD